MENSQWSEKTGVLLNHRILQASPENGMEISNPTDIANNFWDYFTNRGPNLASKIPSTNSSSKDFSSSSLSESISLQPLTVMN